MWGLTAKKSLTVALLVLLLLGLWAQYGKMGEIGFNYLNRPGSNEIYLKEYEPGGFSVHSTSERQCSLCGKPVSLRPGENALDTTGCADRAVLSCGDRSLWFSMNSSFSSPSETAIAAGIKRPYPIFLLASASLSVALSVLLLGRLTPASFLLGIGIVFSALIFHFQLEALGAPWLVLVVLILAAIYALAKRPKLSPAQVGWKGALAVSLTFVIYITLLNSSIGNLDVWSSYYNRQADMTLKNWSPFYYDSLSYLGRPATYPPAFFNLAASFGGLAGAPDFTSFRVLFQLFLAFLFALSTYAVFHRFSRTSAVLATLFILLQWFFTMTATTLSLHTFAYVMLNIALIAPIGLSPIFLGIAFSTHPITLFLYPFYLYASRKFKLDLRATVAIPVLAVALSLIFYIPVFLRSGLPYEIVPERWGYFFTYGLNGMHFEFLLMLPLVALSFAAILKKDHRIPGILVAFFAFLNAFVLYRVNIILTVLFAALFPLVFEKELEDRLNLALVALFLLVNVALIPIIHSGTNDWCTWGVSNDMCISPMRYIERYVLANESIAINPMYGHLETYVGKRPVLADLYVEYASLKKFEAEDRFYYYGDLSKVKQYNVSVVVEDETGWPPRPERRNLTQEDGDRIYDNGFMHITRLVR